MSPEQRAVRPWVAEPIFGRSDAWFFLGTGADEDFPRFSPDGHWIVYRSNESGNNEFYVRPFPPGGGGKWQISNGGGLYAFWSNNGRELFYETSDVRFAGRERITFHCVVHRHNPRSRGVEFTADRVITGEYQAID